MKKLSENKPKHNHNFTDWLKFILFSVLMMAPFFSIATRCLYVINNKNAKDSYYGETINQKTLNSLNNINDLNNVDLYNFYLVQNGTYTGPTGNITIYINDFEDLDNLGLTQTPNNFLYYYLSSNDIAIQLRYDTTVILSPSTATKTLNFNFKYVSSSSNGLPLTDILNYTKKVVYNNYSFLDNAFDYSISQLATSQTFNWTTQTATYEVFDNMLTGLTIQGGILPILLTYWMMLIVVYIIVDIIIKTFTFITHLING